MTKIKSLIEKHYYLLFFFLFILVYSCVVPGGLKPWQTIGVTQSFHAVDYSMGFCSRFFPGAIYNFLFGAVEEQTLNLYMSFLMIAFFFVLSILLEQFVLSVESKYRFVAVVILMFFLTGPVTFSIYIKTLGMLDVYWVFAALLFFVLLSRKETWFLLFIPFVICVLTYYVTWLCYLPFFVIILLYKISITKTKKDKVYLWVALSVSVIIAVALTLYFVFFEKSNLTYTVEGFIDALNAKGSDSYKYYSEVLYYYGYEAPVDVNIFDELLTRLSLSSVSLLHLSKISLVILIVPVVSFVCKFFYKQIKQCDVKLKKFSYFCMVLLFFCTYISSFLTSTDYVRWTAHACLPLFVSFIYVLYNEGSEVWSFVKESFEKINFKMILIYLVFYMSVVYDPYYI